MKKRSVKRMCQLTALVLLLVAMTVLSSCGGGKGGSGSYDGYYMNYMTASVPTLNFLTDSSGGSASEVRGRTSLRLYNYFPDGNGFAKLEGELAESDPVSMNEDGTVWQVKLRQNAKWANGDKITADDFVFSMQTAFDPDMVYSEGTKLASGIVTVKNAQKYTEQNAPGNSKVEWSEVGVQKIDDYTVEITTEKAATAVKIKQHFATGVSLLVHKPTYEACWDAGHTVNDYGSTLDKFMCCGSYILSEWVTDSKYVLTKNPDYVRADEIKLPGIVYRVIEDNNTALEMFLKGELDQVSLGSADIENYRNDPRYKSDPPPQQINVLINNRNTENNGILNNVNFRKALFYGTDRAKIAELRNTIPATYILGSKMVIDESGTTFRSLESSQEYLAKNNGYDPELAKECFDKAMKECGLTSLNLTVIYSESSPNQRPIAEYVQKSWPEIFGNSFSLSLDPKPSSVAYKQRKGWTSNPNSYELALEGYVPTDNILVSALQSYTTGYPNANEYNNNPKVDKLFEEAVYGKRAQVDNDYLVSLCQQMEKELIYSDYITVPVFEIPKAWLLSERVTLAVDERVPGAGWLLDFAEIKS